MDNPQFVQCRQTTESIFSAFERERKEDDINVAGTTVREF